MEARDTIQVNVHCRHETHKIGYRKDGPLILYNHRSKKEDALLDIIDGETCRCRQILQFWANHAYENLPQQLADMRRKQKVIIKGFSAIPSPSPLPMKVRVTERIRKTALSCMRQTDYRRAAGTWAGGNHQNIITFNIGMYGDESRVGIQGESERVFSKNRKWSGNDSRFIIALTPIGWWKVYKAGIAIVEKSGKKLFVLKILEKNKDSFTVLAGRQGKGFNLYAHKALIKKKEGKFWLRWVK